MEIIMAYRRELPVDVMIKMHEQIKPLSNRGRYPGKSFDYALSNLTDISKFDGPKQHGLRVAGKFYFLSNCGYTRIFYPTAEEVICNIPPILLQTHPVAYKIKNASDMFEEMGDQGLMRALVTLYSLKPNATVPEDVANSEISRFTKPDPPVVIPPLGNHQNLQ